MQGEILIILAQFGFAAAMILQKKAMENMHPLLAAILCTAFSAAIVLPFAIYFLKGEFKNSTKMDSVKLVLVAGAFLTFATFVSMYGIQKTDASKVGVLSQVYVLFAIILSAVFLGETQKIINQKFALGAILVAAGAFLLSTI